MSEIIEKLSLAQLVLLIVFYPFSYVRQLSTGTKIILIFIVNLHDKVEIALFQPDSRNQEFYLKWHIYVYIYIL